MLCDTLFAVVFVAIFSVIVASDFSDSEWNDFKDEYSKTYSSISEETARRAIFEANFAKIQKHNEEADRGLHTYKMGKNKYADMSSEEFRRHLQLDRLFDTRHQRMAMQTNRLTSIAIPDQVDWRERGWVSNETFDQGECEAGYAFAAAGAVEGQVANVTGKFVALSAQQLVDCSMLDGNLNCAGGRPDIAFESIQRVKGITTAEAYPFIGNAQHCQLNNSSRIAAKVLRYVDITPGNESALTEALATVGPIAIYMDASRLNDDFRHYKSGVYTPRLGDCCSTCWNHGMLAVGYGVVSNGTQKYYILKNSWGKSWGMDGYMFIDRSGQNACAVAQMTNYPIVTVAP